MQAIDPAATPRRVLVAEDDAVSQRLIREIMRALGHRATVVADGLQAVAAAQMDAFELVLMDINMPRMNGFAAAAEIRRLAEPFGTVPIVALTANARHDDALRSLEAGMNAHLPKPVDVQKIADCIERWSRLAPGRGAP